MSANMDSPVTRGSADQCFATEMDSVRVAVVVKCWPRLSETFIAQEMAGLEARGLKLAIYSLRYPDQFLRSIPRMRAYARRSLISHSI